MKNMANKKYILISMEDERAGKIAEILGNKSSKKIIDFLSEKKDMSEKEISNTLKMPINTVEYNLNKLLHVGLIEKTKNFFGARKEKKISLYKLSNKSIVISPKGKISSKLSSIVPALIFGGVGALLIKSFVKPVSQASELLAKTDTVMSVAGESANAFSILQTLPSWYWFSLGVVLTAIIVTVVNWRKL